MNPLQDKIASRTKEFGAAWESLMRRATIEWPKAKPQADYFQEVYANAPTVPRVSYGDPYRPKARWVGDDLWERIERRSILERTQRSIARAYYTVRDLTDGPNPCIVLGGQDA